MKEEKLSTAQQSNDQKDKTDYYSLPLASFTFGHNDQRLMQMSSKENNESSIRRITYIEEQQAQNDSVKHSNEYNRDVNCPSKSNKAPFSNTSSFINKFGCHNSFLGVVIHAISHMKSFRDFIVNELGDIKEKDSKTRLLSSLKAVLMKYPENKRIDLSQLRANLAELFQNRRKFLLDHPDDPIDCYFAIANAVHSFYMQYPLNEITDESCRDKCFAHRALWLDLARIDECECKGSTKRLFSNHNYVFDIPIDAIFDVVKTVSIYPSESNSKNMKVKERHLSQIPYSMNEIQGKLFLYYKYLLNQIKSDCPVNGTRCNVNKTHKHLMLSNNPAYYVFALQRNSVFQFCISDILKVFILISRIFEVGTLFEQVPNRNNGTSTNVFEFIGCVLLRSSKVYSCVFKSQSGKTVSWVYYDDETVITLSSWFDLVSFCIKNGDIPILLVYHSSDSMSTVPFEISQNDTVALERYAVNADNLSKYYMNRIRILEDVINTQDVNSSNIKGSQVSSTNDSNEHGSVKGDVNPFIRGTNAPVNLNENFNAIQSSGQMKQRPLGVNIINGTVINYYCQNCHTQNKIESKVCVNCGKFNNDTSYEGEDKRFGSYKPSNAPNYALSSLKSKDKSPNPNSNSSNYAIAPNKPMTKASNARDNLLLNSNEKRGNPSLNQNVNPLKGEIKRPVTEQEKDIRAKKYYDMPRQIIQKKEVPVLIKSNLPASPQTNFQSEPESTGKFVAKTEGKAQNSSDIRKPSHNPFQKEINQSEVWSCSNCNTLNKEHEYKCKYCKSIKKTENSYMRIHTPKAQNSSGRHSLNKNTSSNSTKKLEKKKSAGNLEPNPKDDKKYHNFNTISHHHDIDKSTNSLKPSGNKNQNGICYPSKMERPKTSLLEYPQRKGY